MVGENLNINLLDAIYSEELTTPGCSKNETLCPLCQFVKEVEKTELGKTLSNGIVMFSDPLYAIPFKSIVCQVLRMGMKYQQAIIDLKGLQELEKELKGGG